MNRLIIKIVLVLFIISRSIVSSGQKEQIKVMLEGKESFDEITEVFRQYFEIAPDNYETERLKKHFSRWAYYVSMHLGPDGEFVNIAKKTWETVQQLPTVDNTESANGYWSFVGPDASSNSNPDADFLGLGRADRMAFHPTDNDIIYVGTPSGGLWKTTNDGTSWTSISDFIPSLGISGIVVDHSSPNTIYVLTGDGDTYISDYFVYQAGYNQLSAGVLKSTDGGDTWEMTGELSSEEYAGYRLVQHPVNEDILIAATSDGIYRTTDGGDTWTEERSGKHFDVEFKPGDPSRVYATGLGEFVYSTNTGDTWNTDATFDYSLKAGQRVEVAVTPDYSSKVYLLCGPGYNNNTFGGFWVSTNSGSSFTRLCTSPNVLGKGDGTGNQSMYDMGLAVDPDNDLNVIVAGLVVYKSTDGGNSFNQATNYSGSGPPAAYIHPDIHGLEYNPDNGVLYAAGDGGFHKSTDNASTWTDLYDGINTTQFYHFDDCDGTGNQYALLGGCQDNGVKYRNTNTSDFYHAYCCDGSEAAIDYSDNLKGFAVVNDYVARYTNFKTTAPSFIAGPGSFFPQIEMHASDPDILYYSYSSIKKYEVGVGTSNIGDGITKGAWVIRTCPSNSTKFYTAGGTWFAATTGDMWVFTNSGSNWDMISDNTGFPSNHPRITDIGVDPNQSYHVYAVFSGYTANCKVYYSSNSGTSWTNVSHNLPNTPVWSIIVDEANNAYVGTDIGVYYREAGSSYWEPFYNNLPNAPVSDLEINEDYDQIYAATFGRGIWKSALSDPCPSGWSLSGSRDGRYFKSASVSISSTQTLVGGEGTDVAYRAGSYVDLNSGFEADAEPGQKFQAYIGSCGSGLPPDYSGSIPVYPENILDYKISMSRNSGTIEIDGTDRNNHNLIIRQFKDGDVRVVMAEAKGRYVRDITKFKVKANKHVVPFDVSDLKNKFYYIYLIVNDEVVHLQELDLRDI